MLNGQSVIFRSKIICIQFSNNCRVVTILNSLEGIFRFQHESRNLWAGIANYYIQLKNNNNAEFGLIKEGML